MFNVNNKNTRTMSQTLKNEKKENKKKETRKQGKILNPTYQVVLHYFLRNHYNFQTIYRQREKTLGITI